MENNNVGKDPLTESQRELVEKNHDLIYSYARKRNISIDEHYDILAIGLCKAAKTFDDTKGKFSTIAYKCMGNELGMYWRSTQKQSSIPDGCILSYDSQDTRDNPDNQETFLEFFSDYESYNDMMYSVMSEDFRSELTDKEKQVYDLLLDDLSYVEIAEMMGLKKQTINSYMNKIRDKLLGYLGYRLSCN